MRTSAALLACLFGYTSAHGVVTKVVGANGVEMPGLSVADGTPRDCSSNGCGSQADTAIIRDGDIESGAAGPLGRTQGGGPVDAAAMISVFMGEATATTLPQNNANSGVGQEDDIQGAQKAAGNRNNRKVRQLLAGLLGGLGGGNGNNAQGTKTTGPPETMVAATAGSGASDGLPTAADDGTVTLNYLQVSFPTGSADDTYLPSRQADIVCS